MEFPASVETPILMPIEYYTKELGDYKRGGMNSSGWTCPQEGGVLVPPGGEAARKV